MRNIITESIKYWEPRRLVYNAALAAVLVASCYGHRTTFKLAAPNVQIIVGLMVAAAIANVLYCSAYLVDLFVQISEFQEPWKRRRWMLLVAGTLFAAAIFLAHE